MTGERTDCNAICDLSGRSPLLTEDILWIQSQKRFPNILDPMCLTI